MRASWEDIGICLCIMLAALLANEAIAWLDLLGVI